MQTETYHRDLHTFVRDVVVGSVSLDWSRHALLKAEERGFQPIGLGNFPKGSCIELTCSKRTVEKLLVRIPYDTRFDICLVLVPRAAGLYFVVTAWLNANDDTHATLDKSKYAQAA